MSAILSAGFGLLNVFRPDAEAEKPAGNAAQYRPLHQLDD